MKLCLNVNTRPEGLEQIIKACNSNKSICLQLWYTPGYVSMLLLDLFDYQAALTTELFPFATLSCCRTLQALAALFSSPDTVQLCQDANIPLYIVPFLATEGDVSVAAVRVAALGALAVFCSTQPSGARRPKSGDALPDHSEMARRDLSATVLHSLAAPASLLEALIALSLFSQLSAGAKGAAFFSARLEEVRNSFMALISLISRRNTTQPAAPVFSSLSLSVPLSDISVLPPTELERQAAVALTAQAAGIQLLTTLKAFAQRLSPDTRRSFGQPLIGPLQRALSGADAGSLLKETLDVLSS